VDEPKVVVIGGHWQEEHSEIAFVIRSLAGAASRWSNTSVFTTHPDAPRADGAFDVRHLHLPEEHHWPEQIGSDCAVFVDEMTAEVATLLSKVGPRQVHYLVAPDETADPSWHPFLLQDPIEAPEPFVKLYVPVNRHATLHRHNGFGFTGYHLVLSGRTGSHEDPPPEVAWLTAGLHDCHIIVVEDGVAYAWKGRALRGTASVDSRMDLWRLVAHACVCVDLSPGRLIGRECIEAMRFGTPLIVPADSGPGAALASAGRGATFADPGELLEAASYFRREDFQSDAAGAARQYADSNHGSPQAFVESLQDLIRTPRAAG
jgi:hypothetical protein